MNAFLPATFFGQFGWHLIGLAVACAAATIAFYGYHFDGKLTRMAIFWLVSTAMSALFVFAAAIFGATLMVTSIVVEEINEELRDPPEYMQEMPPWRRSPNNGTEGNVEDIQ